MNVPNHIAIILDGNGRWAKAKGLPRGYGHVKGCANLEQVCYDIKDMGVEISDSICFFHWKTGKRSREEVDGAYEAVSQLSEEMYQDIPG